MDETELYVCMYVCAVTELANHDDDDDDDADCRDRRDKSQH